MELEEDVSIVHRLLPKQHMPRLRPKTTGKHVNKHPTVIVRFVSRQKRNEVYANRFKAKSIEEFPVEGMQNLFVNENLIHRRKQLFWKTKQKAKGLGFKCFWTNNGQIYVRENEDTEKIQVNTENDLNNL